MPNDICCCVYARFQTPSKTVGSALMGANHMVGDAYTLCPELQPNRTYRVWLENRFGERVMFLDERHVEQVLQFRARGWTLRTFLVFVALSKEPDSYWGEVVLLAYDPHYDQQFCMFAKNLQKLLSQGVRPALNFNEQTARHIVESGGAWVPTDRAKKPELPAHSAMVKSSRNVSDKLIEAGRNKRVGCWVVTVVFWLLVACALVFGVSKLLGAW